MKKSKIIEEILNSKYINAICERCGDYQSHKLVWCKSCGNKFTKYPKTLLEALKIVKNRGYQNRAVGLTPSWIAAINYRRKLKINDISKKFFIEYTEKLLKEND